MSVNKVKIYTKSGDKGITSLFGGKRIDKDDQRIEVIGTIDELNASLGLTEISIEDKPTKEIIRGIQNQLFNIGALVADPTKITQKTKRMSDFNPKKIFEIEKLIDQIDSKLPQLHNFILPSGSEAGSRLHFSRSLARKVERAVVGLSKKETVDPNIQIYLNRLSDLLFVLARFENIKSGKKETLWKKG